MKAKDCKLISYYTQKLRFPILLFAANQEDEGKLEMCFRAVRFGFSPCKDCKITQKEEIKDEMGNFKTDTIDCN